ncbi:hypothetical protein Holit_01841 [Hollandina sp. SP2]
MGKMTCSYTASGNNDGDEGIGLIVYSFLRNKKNEKTTKMRGLFTDLKYNKRIESYEERFSKWNIDEDILIKKAKELYEKRTNGT